MNCPSLERLLAWMEGEVTLADDRGLRTHVTECARCAAEVRRLRALMVDLSRLPSTAPAPNFVRDIEATLTQQPRRGRRPPSVLLGATAAALCAIAIGIVRFEVTQPNSAGTFVARGSTPQRNARLGFEIYAHEPGRPAFRIREGQRLHTDTGYTFVAINRTRAAQYVMLFALDAHNEVHWFYPAFLDPATDPSARLLPAQPQVQPFPDGVTLDDPAPGLICFVGLFSKLPVRVSTVEALLRSDGLRALSKAFPDTTIQELRAELQEAEAL
jgi:hypothetical protein